MGERSAGGRDGVHAGVRRIGKMLAVAVESLIKIMAFVCVGIFVTWFMFALTGGTVTVTLAEDFVIGRQVTGVQVAALSVREVDGATDLLEVCGAANQATVWEYEGVEYPLIARGLFPGEFYNRSFCHLHGAH